MTEEEHLSVNRKLDMLFWAVLNLTRAIEAIAAGVAIDAVSSIINECHMRAEDLKRVFFRTPPD